MPVYSYICKDCGKKFDLLIGVTAERPELKCPQCDSKNIEKTLASFGIGTSSSSSSSESSCPTGTCPLS
ncbi:MAG: hypothetical protein COW28_03085 [bacterium (Candidatus Ratteibacteria) CG15_BIG_FIL_POST_REV_8_21_14_020_41_12]|uniref:Putative regulatory protein FmdB zinc ribbon domain-containing protein n=1 Tax=bacterium (Candidatus Ratteibacteria) CG15_BIG_FIL_POST_REV_8_21_14_020_41_12 TaxID=2014291 RepID=A0A2M7GYZ6_9BACT|nr:MAG: hypothetical protein COW28_03085 [bacterium (Candidatus Ratteibacteria) CG15_BIG_FIL_POST_REV_8_21_14_020_41_12]